MRREETGGVVGKGAVAQIVSISVQRGEWRDWRAVVKGRKGDDGDLVMVGWGEVWH